MPRSIEVQPGQSFQEGTGLTVRAEGIDANNRVHFSVIEDQEGACAGPGEMSCFVFLSRFSRIDSVEGAGARMKHLGYAASRQVRIYGEEFELLSDPFVQAGQMASRHGANGQKAETAQSRVSQLPLSWRTFLVGRVC
jgi:hypothetical protein